MVQLLELHQYHLTVNIREHYVLLIVAPYMAIMDVTC